MLRIALLIVALFPVHVFAELDEDCGNPFSNGVGPWDYRSSAARNNPGQIPTVERYHFAPKVEQLIEGQSLADLAGDLDYVLRAVPNHHRALYAISRYERQRGSISPEWRSAECYFKRALMFAPDDAVSKMLFGVHWAMREKHEKAVQMYEAALAANSDSAELQYNLGLSLFALGQFEKAQEAAIRAYTGGYPLQGLRRKLEEQGYGWAE